VIDTREQLPLWDPKDPEVLQMKLDEGDYTMSDLKNFAHIERKSGNDLYGSLIQGHERFREEIKRANGKGLKFAVFVECPKTIFIGKRFRGGWRLKMHPRVLAKILITMQKKYNLEFVWCIDRDDMRVKMKEWFDKMREIKNGEAAAD